MADNQGPQLTDDMLNNLINRSNRTGDATVDAIYDLITELRRSNIGRTNPAKESQSQYSDSKWSFKNPNEDNYHSRGDLLSDFEQGIKDQLLDSLAGGNFKKGIQGALDTFTKNFGFDLRNIGHEAGKALTGKAVEWIKKSPLGQEAGKKLKSAGNWALNKAFDRQGADGQAAKQGILDMVKAFRNGGQGSSNLTGALGKYATKLGDSGAANVASNVVGNSASKLAISGAGKGALAGKGGAVLAKGAAALGPYALLIVGIVYTIVKVLGPALKGLAEMAKALGKSFNREEEMRKKMLENSKKRLENDIKQLTEKPFEILEEATKKWEDAWDQNLRKIGQTQGYDKESVYALYESYAERLRSEGYANVINATDVVDKLASVLDSGLSGKAAEEFAYAATKLNAAIPNQDFFSYVDTYASIAANAISQGQSQTQALELANSQLEQFASNLLYSSRELAGGFTTGLKNSSTLFQQATQIAQSAKSSNAAEISGTLTSVSAIIGAVAPDLADSLVSNVVQAAIGGNNETIVALRSLAGINAGNTEFLKTMAEDPKAVFSDLFSNLAQMQNMSPDNYMEVAEGLANIFGIDKAAFARVDFNYLANAINSMNANNASLDENLKLLQSGQTTTSAEQLKAQEINKVILEEGLAYVIDNEAGRMIQQNMWEEQRANALMENEYAVSLHGSALEFLEGIRKTLTTLMNFLNPVGFIAKGVTNMAKTIAESVGNDQDIKEILRLGAVGGNAWALGNLTTRGKDLGLTKSLVEMMGGTKGTKALNDLVNTFGKANNALSNITQFALTGVMTPTSDQMNKIWDKASGGLGSNIGSGVAVQSKYAWGQVGKSVAKAIQTTTMNKNALGSVVQAATTATSTQLAKDKSNKRFESFLATAQEASKTMSYEQWVDSAKLKGIANFEQALEDYGRSESDLRNYFEQHEAAQGAAIEENRKKDEELFRKENREFWDYNSGTSGIFQTSMWLPFFGQGMKYDTRMDAVDLALTDIQNRIGSHEEHTVISGIEELSEKLGNHSQHTVINVLEVLEREFNQHFVASGSTFQKCLRDWNSYIISKNDYNKTVDSSSAWKNLQDALGNKQAQASLALANALGKFTDEQISNLDPQLQANVLLGEIVVILQAIMQQNNTQAGGLSLIDTISALGLGATKK